MAINHEDLAEQDKRRSNEPDYDVETESEYIREEWFKKVPDDEWAITHEATAPFFALRAVPSFDIEIRFKTRAVRHIMTTKEARAFANALLAAVRNTEKEQRAYNTPSVRPEHLTGDVIQRRTLR